MKDKPMHIETCDKCKSITIEEGEPRLGVPFRLTMLIESQREQVQLNIANKCFKKWQEENEGYINDLFDKL